jgi:hypothetical protein
MGPIHRAARATVTAPLSPAARWAARAAGGGAGRVRFLLAQRAAIEHPSTASR